MRCLRGRPRRSWSLVVAATVAVSPAALAFSPSGGGSSSNECPDAWVEDEVALLQHPRAPRRESSSNAATDAPPRHPPQAHVVVGTVTEPLHRTGGKRHNVQSSRNTAPLAANVFIPGGALILAGALWVMKQRTIALLLAYFGMQSGLSLYMKIMLSDAVVSEELGLYGVPAPFLVTAVQQITILGMLVPARPFLRCVFQEDRLRTTPLTTTSEWVAVLIYSCTFAMNIGLNNFSLSLVSVSENLVIRSCTPIAVAMIEWLAWRWCVSHRRRGCSGAFDDDDTPPLASSVEVVVMLVGVLFAGLATVASQKSMTESGNGGSFYIGVIVCSISVFAAALNLVDSRTLGSTFGVSALDSCVYTAVPTTVFLLVPGIFIRHTVAWPGHTALTDWQVVRKLLELQPGLVGLIFLSGLLATGLNILQFMLVNQISATHTAFSGNCNKAVTMMLSIGLGLEKLPSGVWSDVMVVSLLGNLAMFTVFSLMAAQSQTQRIAAHPKNREEEHLGAEKWLWPSGTDSAFTTENETDANDSASEPSSAR